MIDIGPLHNVESITLHEKVDVPSAHLINALCKYVPELDDVEGLDKYISQARDTGAVSVRYTNESSGIGRLNWSVLDKNGEEITCHCQVGLKGCVKAAICSKNLRDMDIDNAHPVLLAQIFNQCELPCPVLKRYITERPRLIEESGLSKDEFKKCAFQIFYYPTRKGDTLTDPIFTELQKEISDGTEALLKRYPSYLERARQVKGRDYYNLNGTALAYLAQTAEKRCLLALYDFWQSHKVHVSALIHDGLHVDRDAATDEMLPLAATHIYEQTGFKVSLSYKDWRLLPEFKNAAVVSDTVSAADFVHTQIAGRLVRCNDRVFFRDDTHKWQSDQNAARRYVTRAVSGLHIFNSRYQSLSRNYTDMTQISKVVFDTAPDDPQFLILGSLGGLIGSLILDGVSLDNLWAWLAPVANHGVWVRLVPKGTTTCGC